MTKIVCLAVVLLWSLRPAEAGEELSYVDLVNRITDLEAVAVLPEPGEKRAKATSYDRRSRYDEATDKYIDWGANLRKDRTGDGDGIIRKENGVDVLAEMEGPGCIWRIYSAQALEGHIKIYLDGADEPAVDMPFKDYLSGEVAPFNYPELVYRVEARGRSCFVPVPYQKSCKIVGEGNWGRFYHFTYSTFPEDTRVPTFTRDLPPHALDALQKLNDYFRDQLGTDPAGTRKGEKTLTNEIVLSPGKTVKVARIEGARAITAFRVKMGKKMDRDTAAKILRAVTLQMTWDQEDAPAVWTPLGDFFGTTPGINLYKSLVMGMTEDGFYSLWYMPFTSGALIEMSNDGDMTCSFEVSVTHAPLSRPANELGRFHAKWHRDAFLPKEPERNPGEHWKIGYDVGPCQDWPLLKTRGRGRYCGVMLHVWNPKGGWFGEGDEKFFVDGEKFPSSFGTGTEEYFGYAWCRPDRFHRALHNQTFNWGRNTGHVSVNRSNVADNTPFQKSFEGAIEKFFPNSRPTNYAALPFWYLESGGTDPYAPLSLEERTGYYEYIVRPVNRTEASFDVFSFNADLHQTTGGSAHEFQVGTGETRWKYYVWEGASAGDRLVFETPPLIDAGKYEICMKLVRGPNKGHVQLYLDDFELGEPIDLNSKNALAPTEELSFGVHELTEGYQTFTVEMLDAGDDVADFGIYSMDLKWVE